mmetsp:Transcript_87764/g.246612  ORF Transcript_87764/g.246612 Transcript_87764/m.246612 type:complete len:232 (-) Transcript_87764:105-800(-)
MASSQPANPRVDKAGNAAPGHIRPGPMKAPSVTVNTPQDRRLVPTRGPAGNKMQAEINAALASANFAPFQTFDEPSGLSSDSARNEGGVEASSGVTSADDRNSSLAAAASGPSAPEDCADNPAGEVVVVEDIEKARVERYLKRMRKEQREKKEKKMKKTTKTSAGPEEPEEIRKEKKRKEKLEKLQKVEDSARKKQEDKERALIAADRATKRVFGRAALVIESSSGSEVCE